MSAQIARGTAMATALGRVEVCIVEREESEREFWPEKGIRDGEGGTEYGI